MTHARQREGSHACSKDVLRAQYEEPGFAAGVVGLLLDQALELCAHAVRLGQGTLLLDGIAERMRIARQHTTDWMRLAQMLTNYDAARVAVSKQGR